MEQTRKTFDDSLKGSNLFPLTASGISIFQLNVGRLCNLSCRHCHVEAGPKRTEVMSRETMEACLSVIKDADCPTVDITGGAPEMNPNYRWFIKRLSGLGCPVKTRTNLTILLEEGYRDLPEFFAEHNVEVVASLPYYLEETTERLRGKGVFKASIEALKKLNSLGYGLDGSILQLNLVYNPCGAFLPPRQKELEADFRKELDRSYGISFSELFTITNMPVGRFLKFLKDSGNLNRYMERLRTSYNPAAASKVMCTQMVSISWEGSLYDCDFNQMLGMKCNHGAPDNIKDFCMEKLRNRQIVTGEHCYGCTAGAGSSCTGAVS